MHKYKIIKLKNLSPLHMGTGKENYDFSSASLHSDTLSAALAAIRAQIGLKDDLDHFINSFKISSAFPYYQNRLFFPKPKGKLPVDSTQEEHEIRKDLKKVQFIEFNLWKDLISGKSLTITKEQINGEYLVAGNKIENADKAEVNQRVGVARDGEGKTDPFYFEWRFFSPEAGLFCLVDSDDSGFDEVLNLFKELGERGIGTDKNVGGGKFEIEASEIELPRIDNASHLMLLSLYIPTSDEMGSFKLDQSKYELILRGGFIAGSSKENLRHLRKKSIYAFNTGSLLDTTEKLNGKVVDLQPEWNDSEMHPVYRSGLALYIPVKIEDYE